MMTCFRLEDVPEAGAQDRAGGGNGSAVAADAGGGGSDPGGAAARAAHPFGAGLSGYRNGQASRYAGHEECFSKSASDRNDRCDDAHDPGCGGSLSGKYEAANGVLSVEFTSSKAHISTLVMTFEADYETQSDKVILKMPAGNMVLTRNNDGTFDSPFGTLTKSKS
jgi:hypothetical protein